MRQIFQLRSKILGLIVFGLTILHTVNARDIKMVTTQWAPFYSKQLPKDGPVTEIVIEAFKRAGHNASVEYLPWDRALRKVRDTGADIVLGAYYTEPRAKEFTYSSPILMVDVGLIAGAHIDIIRYSSLRDLNRFRIGVAKGWANSPEFDAAQYLNKDVAKNQILNIRKLKHARVDMIAVSFEVFRHENAKFPPPYSSQKHVYLEPLLSRSSLHLMMNNKLDDHKQIIAGFNLALQQMKVDRTYDKILRAHKIAPSAACADD